MRGLTISIRDSFMPPHRERSTPCRVDTRYALQGHFPGHTQSLEDRAGIRASVENRAAAEPRCGHVKKRPFEVFRRQNEQNGNP